MASPRKRRFILVVVLLGVLGGLAAWQWQPIRVKVILWGTGPDEEKAEALRALGTPAIPALIGVYESAGGSWEDKVLIGGLLVREPYRRVTVLERGLDSESVTTRRVSTSLLLATHNFDERDRLLESLKDWSADPGFGRRVELADAAKELRGSEAIAILVSILGDRERARRARFNAAEYLGSYFLSEAAIIAPLVSAARTDSSELVRAKALQSLGSAGWSEDMSVFEALLDAEDSRARHMLVFGLGALALPKSEALLGRLLADPVEVVRRSALRRLTALGSRLVAENAELLREDWFMGVRGDLSQGIGTLGDESLLPVLFRGLLDEEPDGEFNVIQKTIWALHEITGKHHGFPDEPFERSRRDPAILREAAREWAQKPAAEKDRFMRMWGEKYGAYDRRPALLRQLRHADPANVARAVREFAALNPEAATPGFAGSVVKAAIGVVDPDDAAFKALVEEARGFQALSDEKREEHLTEWAAREGQ